MGGMANPRICEMGATNDDVGFSGCLPQTKYTVPVKSGPFAQPNPVGGKRPDNWKPEEGPNTFPRAGVGKGVYFDFPVGPDTQAHPTLA